MFNRAKSCGLFTSRGGIFAVVMRHGVQRGGSDADRRADGMTEDGCGCIHVFDIDQDLGPNQEPRYSLV